MSENSPRSGQRRLCLSRDGKTVDVHVDVDTELILTLSEDKKARLIDFVERVIRGEPARLNL